MSTDKTIETNGARSLRSVTEIAGRSIGAGSIVELKTGGPSMAVETRTPEKAYCVWHNHEGDLLRDWVPIVCLKVKA